MGGVLRALLLAVVLACVGVYSQTPQRCDMPMVFEGRYSIWDHARGMHDIGFYAYDANNERIYEKEEVDSFSPGRQFYERLLLYKEDMMYEVNLAHKTCRQGPIPESRKWTPWGIPVNATFRSYAEVGISGDGVLVQSWELPVHRHPEEWFASGIVTVRECVPVQHVIAHNVSYSIVQNFYDIVLGIEDPNVFLPPAECSEQAHTV